MALVRDKWKIHPWGCIYLMLCILLVSCSSTKNLKLAEQAVTQFHTQLESEQYREMYATTDQMLRDVSNESDFVAQLQRIHHRLGKLHHTDVMGFLLTWSGQQGSLVTLSYHTQFAEGEATEEFVWHFINGHPKLASYSINSDVLALK